jgi:Domain of unknown function (DUF5664)
LETVTTGTKHDNGKAPLSLVPVDALIEIAQVFRFGAQKYAAFNWTGGFAHRRLYDAALRHIMSSVAGEDFDEESGRDHLAHAGCCILMLLAHRIRGLGSDDRGPKENRREAFATPLQEALLPLESLD